jgi:hypothetical protein
MTGDEHVRDYWRENGFYYDFDGRIDVNQWRVYGSKKGLGNFVKILEAYILDERNAEIGEHEHYQPYYNLIITTLTSPCITDRFLEGTIQNLSDLKVILENKIENTEIGATFNIDQDYGVGNTVTAKFFVMCDTFDPSSMDELIVSGRQSIVNIKLGKTKL